MGRKSFKSDVYEATESFSQRLADRDPELMAKLAEMRGKNLSVTISRSFHGNFTTDAGDVERTTEGQGLV